VLRIAWARYLPLLALVPTTVAVLIACPAYRDYREQRDLEQTTAAIAGQLARAQARALATGEMQTVRLGSGPDASTGRIASRGSSASGEAWQPPPGVTYLWAPGTCNTFRMTIEGRCADEGLVILRDRRGRRDTVTVRYSGVVKSR
jgi:hypothetical protein